MSEAVLDQAVENIADGLTVDWAGVAGDAPNGDSKLARCLRIISDVANMHRADAINLLTEMPTGPAPHTVANPVGVSDAWGKYKLADRVGAGSYGAVYRAWDPELERDVAIKILHDRFGDSRLTENLLKEGRALAKIRHDNVVRVLGIEAHGDRVALCMEFVKGQTLDDVVRQHGTLSAREAIGIGEDLCRALAAVHRAGYIHRDVKAKNVMRDETGRIMLMDFGTGRMADGPARGDRAGTPLYMAPEVLEGRPASTSSDVYSLGVLLYHLVSGAYPVEARTVDQLRESHAARRHRWLSERRPDLPVAFMQVVEKAIALDPMERYANPSELLAALGALRVNPHPVLVRVTKWALAVLLVGVGMTALGAITTTTFNIALDRSDFVQEGLWDYVLWGRRTSFPPVLILMMVSLAVSALVVCRRLLIATAKPAAAFDARVRRRLAGVIHTLRMDEAPVLASYGLLVSAVALAAAWWYFTPLILALVSRVSTASAADLALLSPGNVTYHNYYRGVFSAVVMIAVAVWYPVWRLARKGQSVHWGLVAGGVLLTCVSMALLHFPHRLLYFNKSFDAVLWNDQRCYVIGERQDDRLLFCPESSPPRNRVVKAGDKTLVPVNVRESIFSRFAEPESNPRGRDKS